MSEVRFSVIIPTCDRPNLLKHSLNLCLNVDFDDYEVIVSNNGAGVETQEIIAQFADHPKLRVINIEKRIGLIEHWNYFYEQARGEYIIINCDDDGIAPNLLSYLDGIARDYGAKLMSWEAGLYFHPDWEFNYGGNVFALDAGHCGLVLQLNFKKMFERFAQFDTKFFPKATQFCFSRELAEMVISTTGKLFWPPAVDLTTPMLMLGHLREHEYLYIDDCLGFGGRSYASNAASFEVDGERRGNQSKSVEFWKEQENIDLYPFQSLKIRALCNSNVQCVSLYRHFFPDRTFGVDIDYFLFFVKTRLEMLEITHANPFFDSEEWVVFERFLAKYDDSFLDNLDNTLLQHLKGVKISQSRLLKKLASVVSAQKTARLSLGIPPVKIDLLEKYVAEVAASNREGEYQSSNQEILADKWEKSFLPEPGGSRVMIRVNDFDLRSGFDLGMNLSKIVEKFDTRNFSRVYHLLVEGVVRSIHRLPDI